MEEPDQFSEEQERQTKASKAKADEARALMAARIEGSCARVVGANIGILEAEAEDKALVVTKDLLRLIESCGRACYLAGVSGMSLNLITNAQNNLDCIELVQRRRQMIEQGKKGKLNK